MFFANCFVQVTQSDDNQIETFFLQAFPALKMKLLIPLLYKVSNRLCAQQKWLCACLFARKTKDKRAQWRAFYLFIADFFAT